MEKNMKELLERNNFVVYMFEDDERSNINEVCITKVSRTNKYLVDVEGKQVFVDTLPEARQKRDELLALEGVRIVER